MAAQMKRFLAEKFSYPAHKMLQDSLKIWLLNSN